MGVHGLTTFFKENRSTLSKTIHFSPQYAEYTPLVVDGWSFIYKLFEDSGLPWVYGGEYDVFSELIVKVVKAWLAVRLRPIFVFDGSLPSIKFATAVSRKNESFVKPSQLFFRTSAASRNTRRFLNETHIIPPLVHAVTVHTLLSLDDLTGRDISEEEDARLIELHFADEEADSYAVDLAGRVGGYVTGRDSDFVVYNSEGYLGYIPLEEMVWLASEDENSRAVSDEIDDGFQSVKRKKKSAPKQTSTLGIIPPDAEIYSLSVSLFTPSALAHHLKLPVSLLPLLGALVGNDYTLTASDRPVYAFNPKSFHNLLFERRLNLSQRILHASSVLNSCLHGHSSKRRQKKPQSVMELIQMTVGALLTSSGAPAVLIGSGQQEAIVEAVVEGTMPYAIPLRPADGVFLSETVCALHEPFECQLVAQMDRTGIEGLSKHAEAVSALYLRAYRLGQFSPLLMDILSTRTSWPRIFLENPDMEAVSRSVSRHVREFSYALLEAGVIIPAPPATEDEDENHGDEVDMEMEEDLDEVIDVVEESEEDEYDHEDEISADVGKLRGALRELQFDEDGQADAEHSIDERSSMAEDSSVKGSIAPSSSVRSPAPLGRPAYVRKAISAQRKVVTEYVRRGARVVTEDIEVRPLRQFNVVEEDETITIPVQLRSEDERLDVLFRFLQIDPQEISVLPEEDWMPIMALRLVVRRMHDRAAENITPKERQLEKWTRREARAFLASVSQSTSSQMSSLEPPVEISERSIQLTAQISTTLEALENLIQILLLADAIPGCVHRFSGLRFHSLLALDTEADVADDIWRVFTSGLDACFAEERKGKKARRKAQNEDSSGDGKVRATSFPNGRAKTAGRGGMYSILADMSA